MKTATLIMEGSRKQAEFVHYALTKLLSFVRWQDTIFFEITEEQNKCLSKDYMTLRETWWPVARSLLKKEGEADIESFQQLISSANLLSQRITKILGRNLINKITTPVDFYFICSSLPFEWLLCDGVPLSLYAPFYRFVKPQHILSRFAPIDDGKKSFIAPKYSDPSLSGINDAVKESTYWVINDPSVALLENNVSKSIIHQYEDRQFSRLLFHGHSKKEGMLASNGEIIPFNEILRLVQGPAFILGCSTGAFDSGQIHKMGSQIPLGLHGALLCSFPIPGEFSKLIDLNDLTIKAKLEELIYRAKDKNLMVNAGHDLNLINLPHLVKIGGVNEVSIGHAIVVDALNYGFEDTIKRYIEVIKG